MKDFSPTMIRKLRKKGIRITGPAHEGDTREYLLDDNGEDKVKSFLEILELVA